MILNLGYLSQSLVQAFKKIKLPDPTSTNLFAVGLGYGLDACYFF